MTAREPESWPLPFDENPILDLSGGIVALELLPVAVGETARIEVSGGWRNDVSAPQISTDGGVVQVKFAQVSFGWPPWGRGRQGSFRLLVPANVRARVRCAAGQIRVQSLAGCDLDLSTGAGQIALRDVHGRLTLEASAGEIRGERVGGTLEVEANLGSVRLEVDALDPGTHHIHSSMGSVRLSLVEGLKVRIDAQTSMGSTRNRYPSTLDAETILSLETDLGSVRVDPGGSAGEGGWEDWRRCWGDGRSWPNAPARSGPHETHFRRVARHRWHWFQEPFGDSPVDRPPPGAAPAGASDDELKRILTLVEQGKINATQADDLIRALQGR